ncbi:hypothetical protein HDU96_010779, partial [Phlyctochytrium bullatum]
MDASPSQQLPSQEQPPIHEPAGIPAIAFPGASLTDVVSAAAAKASNSGKPPNPTTTGRKKAPVASPKKARKASAQSAKAATEEPGSVVVSGVSTSASTNTGTGSAKKRKPTLGEDVAAPAASKAKRNRVSVDSVASEVTPEGLRGERRALGDDEDEDMGEACEGEGEADQDGDVDDAGEVFAGYIFDGNFI